MSSSPVPLKTHHVEALSRLKFLPVCMECRSGRFQLRCRPRHLTEVLPLMYSDNLDRRCHPESHPRHSTLVPVYEASHQKPLRDSKSDINYK
ncbi:hypothetical protein TNCV_519311 [Trichonephila clavipes]|nr:hypothetical protein TNCV_519311 [Trichonephila clavipes]